MGELCGNAIGCSYTVREGKNCGVTSHCDQCELRASLLKAFSEKVPTYRSMLKREFFIGNEPLNKYFMFTTRYIDYRGDQMVLIIVDDVTELETQRLHLADLNQTKNRFLGIAAHDLRNPIAVIKGYVSLFLGGMLGEVSETQRDVLARMGRTGENMLNLINNLLDVSSIEAGRLDLATRPVALGDFLIECHAANELLARAKSIELKLSAEGGLPEVVMDPNRISQVINNLVTNAIKFSQPQTTIEIKARRLDGQVQVEVADQGPGIPEEGIAQDVQGVRQDQRAADRRREEHGAWVGHRQAHGRGARRSNWRPEPFGRGIGLLLHASGGRPPSRGPRQSSVKYAKRS